MLIYIVKMCASILYKNVTTNYRDDDRSVSSYVFNLNCLYDSYLLWPLKILMVFIYLWMTTWTRTMSTSLAFSSLSQVETFHLTHPFNLLHHQHSHPFHQRSFSLSYTHIPSSKLNCFISTENFLSSYTYGAIMSA